MNQISAPALVRRAPALDPADFVALAENLPQLAWMAEADGWIFWYNRRWYEYTGTTPADMEGWGWQSVHDPAVLPDVLARWTASIATGEPFDVSAARRRRRLSPLPDARSASA